MYILANMWFTKLIKQFFFWIDKIVFNFISSIYDLLLTIARTSVLTQADIADMANRIYKLLAVFMVFKVTLSLITYVVNPDDFSDKSKGVAKLGTNIVISLAMLVLTPYIFNYAYQFQTIILEDNSLATLIFGGNECKDETSFFNSAGDDMAFITMSAFLSPNLSLDGLHVCSVLLETTTSTDTCEEDTIKFNSACEAALTKLTEDNPNFDTNTKLNYIGGVENNSLGLMFRQELITATNKGNTDFIMDYKFIFSTVVGVVIILLLITFCMDVAVRSIKLAFLQLIAPIPILSYVDPKSGKDGLFKKWYEMCIKTFVSLFVRLLALYFAVYIISKVADMKLVDIVDGSYQTGFLLSVFVIIGALMFAKQLPKILEGLGIKLDGDGKFTLNPFKKFEEEAIGGKRITGAAGGLIAGAARGRLLSGAARGFIGNKGFSGGFHRQADVNRKIGEARMKGAGFWGSRFAGVASALGMENIGLENKTKKYNRDKKQIELAERGLQSQIQAKENRKKLIEDKLKPDQNKAKTKKIVSDSGKALVDFSKSEITGGKAGVISTKSKFLQNTHAYLEQHQNEKAKTDIKYYAKNNETGKLEPRTIKKGELITSVIASDAQEAIGFYENKQGAIEHLEVRLKGNEGMKPKKEVTNEFGLVDYERDKDDNIIYVDMSEEEKKEYLSAHSDFTATYETYSETATANGETAEKTAKQIKTQSDALSSEAQMITAKHADAQKQIADLEAEMSTLREETKVKYDGEEITIAEAKQKLEKRGKEIDDIKERLKTNLDLSNGRRFFDGSGK